MLKFSEVDNFYVFVQSTNENIKRNIKVLTSGLNFSTFGSSTQENKISGIFYKDSFTAGNNTFYNFEKVNDHRDYDLSSFDFSSSPHLDDSFDSLISFCFIKDDRFIAGTDYLSILNHYFYQDKDTFICSNNMFMVSKLCDEQPSETALFEALFFRFPYKNNTYFSSIQSLDPYQQLMFTEKNGLKISSSITYYDLILEGTNDISTDINQFFLKLNNSGNLPHFISFSGGSDSMALLSMLKKNKIDCKLASFTGHSGWDTHRIKKLSKKTGYPLLFLDTELFETSLDNELQYAFLTNGFLLSIHFYHFYKNLPQKSQIFDGYSMMLGDMSPATLYPPFVNVLQGLSIDTVLEKYFTGFSRPFTERMKDYLMTNYKDQFLNFNTPEGFKNIKQYCVEGVMSKIYSNIIKCATNHGHDNVSFYLSRKFISYIEKNGYGIASTCLGRDDYPGYVMNRKPLGEIVQKMDHKIYRLKLDQGLSFKDINENNRYRFFKKKLKALDEKIFLAIHKKKRLLPLQESIEPGYFEFINPDVPLNKYAKDSLSIFTCLRLMSDKIEG
jgi:hypothetical protein